MAKTKAIIDISCQNDYTADSLRAELSQLRRYVMDIASGSICEPTVKEMCERLAVLNWLTDDVTFIGGGSPAASG